MDEIIGTHNAGFRIIDRTATPMTATPRGQAFIDEAKTLPSFADHAHYDIDTAQSDGCR